MLGHPCDVASWESTAVPKNGFNPSWNEETSFVIKVPELAMVEFKVRSYIFLSTPPQLKSKAKTVGGQDDHLGSFSVALPLMRKGYRNITLQVEMGTFHPLCRTTRAADSLLRICSCISASWSGWQAIKGNLKASKQKCDKSFEIKASTGS